MLVAEQQHSQDPRIADHSTAKIQNGAWQGDT
jgi:hypothetical protein